MEMIVNKARSRQFVNLVMESCRTGRNSLGRMEANKLFYANTAEAQEAETAAKKAKVNAWSEMKRSSPLPAPKIRFGESELGNEKFDFLPFFGPDSSSESRILCIDRTGNTFSYDTDSSSISSFPCLNEPKGRNPVSMSITRADAPDPRRADAIYIMDRLPSKHKQCNFEVLIYDDHPDSPLMLRKRGHYVWQWHRLPSPPYVDDPTYNRTSIGSYMLLDRSTFCISSAAGTYRFDTTSGEWTKAGGWMLPFYGRAEHVPELGNLCFGVADSHPNHFCAMDLSSTRKRAPGLKYHWPDLKLPKNWVQMDGSMVYLGSGKFCISKACHIIDEGSGEPMDFASVLTGVEVLQDEGSSKLKMIRHKSKCYSYGIDCVL